MWLMSKGTNNCLQINSNIKYGIKIGSLIDHKASLQIKWQATLAQYNVASLDDKRPRENAQKSSAITKGALVRNPLAITYVANIYEYDTLACVRLNNFAVACKIYL